MFAALRLTLPPPVRDEIAARLRRGTGPAPSRAKPLIMSRNGTDDGVPERAMKHPSSRLIFDYWNTQRGDRPMPDRSEIDPAAIRSALSDTFILAFNTQERHPFRLSGTRLCALFGQELKGRSFVDLWDAPKQRVIFDLVRIAAGESVGVVIGAVGWTESDLSVELELLLLPLTLRGKTHMRLMGAIAPLSVPFWIGATPVRKLALVGHRFLGPRHDRVPIPVVSIPEEVADIRGRLVVHDGGQR